MSEPIKTTIYELPTSVSQRYAQDEISKNSSIYQDISSTNASMRPQVAVLAPAQESHLAELTGVLGKTQSLALYEAPPVEGVTEEVFSYTVFPALLEKDVSLFNDKLSVLSKETNNQEVNKVIEAISTLSKLNSMGMDAFTHCRLLKKG